MTMAEDRNTPGDIALSQSSWTQEAQGLLGNLEEQADGPVQLEMVHRLQQTFRQAEQELAALAQRERAAQAEAARARADAEELVVWAPGLIARKRKAEAMLRENHALLYAVTEGVTDAVFVKDTQSRYLLINTAGAQRLGRPVEEVLGRNDAALLVPEVAVQIRTHDQKVMAEGETLTYEETRTWPGSTRTYLTTIGPHRDNQGRIIGVLGISRDITERKRAEEALRQLNAELENRVQQRTAQLAAANRELEAFTYSVSHDLRAPLRHVTGYVQMLEKHAGSCLEETGRRYVRTIAEAARRMGHLIDDLLILSRLSRAAMAETDVSLRQLVDDARQQLTSETAGRAVEWQIGPLPEVRGDPALLQSVMVNLLSNAIKYTRNRNPARIEIGAEQRNGETICFVRDNGVGFDMRFVDKLFEAFQRLHRAEEFEGTGIGLASVRRIIQRHGGRAWAEGAVDRGATFYISLPSGRSNA